MVWSRLFGAIAVAAIALTALGGFGILATRTLPSQHVVASAGVLVLVLLLVGGTAALGRTAGGSRGTPYW